LQALAKANGTTLSKHQAILNYCWYIKANNSYPKLISKMKNKKKTLNLTLGAVIAAVAISLLSGQFLLSASKDNSNSTVSELAVHHK